MSIRIAVFFNENNNLASFFEPATVKIFEDTNDKWIVIHEFPFFFDKNKEISFLRNQLSELISLINGVKVVVASNISGIPYNILDKEGFDICEINQFSPILLDEIKNVKNKEKVSNSINTPDKINTAPVETEISGNFFFDLKKALENNPLTTSKKTLLPFLKNTPFHVLEVSCNHVPPWFDTELERLNLSYEVNKISPNYLVKIYKKVCE